MSDIKAITLHEWLDAAQFLRNIADDIDEMCLNDVPVVVVIKWPDGAEVFAGGKIPNLDRANTILDLGKMRLLELESE